MHSLPEFNQKNIEPANVNQLLPLFIRQNSRSLVKLLEEYYTFLNQKDNPSYVIQRIIDEHDLDKVVDPLYLDKIKDEIAKSIPNSPYVQRTFLLKRIIDSYSLRGNDESVLYFFRVFFNENVTLYNPWEQVLIPSQGKWIQTTSTYIILYSGNETLLENNILQQYDSRGRLRGSVGIDVVERKTFNGKFYFKLYLKRDTLKGVFDEVFDIQTADGACRGRILRSLNKIQIASGGTGYEQNDRVSIEYKENISFTTLVQRVDSVGKIQRLITYDPGLSSSVHYFNDVQNNPALIPNLSEVYLNGILENPSENVFQIRTGFPPSEDLPEGNIFPIHVEESPIGIEKLNFYVGRLVDVTGIITSRGVQVATMNDQIDSVVCRDFAYYDEASVPTDTSEDFKQIDNVIVQTVNGNGAQFEFAFGLFNTTDGYYADEKGRPSGFSVLQDSFYYQVFSYEVNSSLPIINWKADFEEVIHPAGFKVFNRINSIAESDLDASLLNSTNINTNDVPPIYELTQKIGIKSSSFALMQNYNFNENDPGPYFLEDYISTLLQEYDLEYDAYDLVYGDPYVDPYGYDLYLSTQIQLQIGLDYTTYWDMSKLFADQLLTAQTPLSDDPYFDQVIDPYGILPAEGDQVYFRQFGSTLWIPR